ncbi:MAG: hypothetical protein FJW20_11555 [Acidimicrobiia bacterium]|nr:hypothetical protein [Acidimicrobiia bacterium]
MKKTLAVAAALVALSGCGNRDELIKDTPDYQWTQARESYAAGRHLDAYDHLIWLVRSENPHLAQARSQLLILQSGIARGYLELLDGYQKARPGGASKQLQARIEKYREAASEIAFRFAQTYDDLQKSQPSGEIVIPFPLPPGKLAPGAALTKLSSGAELSEQEQEAALKQAMERSVLRAALEVAAGAEGEVEARTAMKQSPARIPRAVFEYGMLVGLHGASELFAASRLAQRHQQSSLLYQARVAAGKAPEGEATSSLAAAVERGIKGE